MKHAIWLGVGGWLFFAQQFFPMDVQVKVEQSSHNKSTLSVKIPPQYSIAFENEATGESTMIPFSNGGWKDALNASALEESERLKELSSGSFSVSASYQNTVRLLCATIACKRSLGSLFTIFNHKTVQERIDLYDFCCRYQLFPEYILLFLSKFLEASLHEEAFLNVVLGSSSPNIDNSPREKRDLLRGIRSFVGDGDVYNPLGAIIPGKKVKDIAWGDNFRTCVLTFRDAVCVYRLVDGKYREEQRIPTQSNAVVQTSLSEDLCKLAIHYEGEVAVFEYNKGIYELKTSFKLDKEVRKEWWDTSHTRLIVEYKERIRFFNIDGTFYEFLFESPVNHIFMSKDLARMMLWFEDGTVRIYQRDYESYQKLVSYGDENMKINNIFYTPDLRRIFMKGDDATINKKWLILVDITPQRTKVREQALKELKLKFSHIALSEQSSRIAFIAQGPLIFIEDGKEGKSSLKKVVYQRSSDDNHKIISMNCTPDLSKIALWLDNNSIVVYQYIQTPRGMEYYPVHVIEPEKQIRHMWVNEDCKKIALCLSGYEVRVYESGEIPLSVHQLLLFPALQSYISKFLGETALQEKRFQMSEKVKNFLKSYPQPYQDLLNRIWLSSCN